MKNIIILLFTMLAFDVNAQVAGMITNTESATGTTESASLYSQFNLGVGSLDMRIKSSATDPSGTALAGNAGSLLLNTSGDLYIKQDAGVTTNWKNISSNRDGDLDFFYNQNYETAGESLYTLVGTAWTKADNTTTEINGNRSVTFTQTGSTVALDRVESASIALALNQQDTTIGFSGRYSSTEAGQDFVVYDVTNSAELGRLELPLSLEVKTFKLLVNTLSTTANIKFYFEVGVAVSGAVLEVDDIQARINPLATVGSVQSETIAYNGYLALSSSRIRLKTEVLNEGSTLLEVDNTTYTKITALGDCKVVASVSGARAAGNAIIGVKIYDSSDVLLWNPFTLTPAANNNGAASANYSLRKGDYVVFHSADILVDSPDTTFSVTATATSANVVFEGATSDLDWTAYSPISQGVGSATFTTEWRRDGPDLLLRGAYDPATPTASEVQIGLPSGLAVKSGTAAEIAGSYFIVTSAVRNGGSIIITGDDTYFNISGDSIFGAATNTNPLTPVTGTSGSNTTAPRSFTARIPIEGWKASDAIYSVPVTNLVENVFSAKINNVGSTDVASESSPFIQGIVRNSTGLTTITWVPGFFTTPPAITLAAENTSNYYMQVSSVTTTTLVVYSRTGGSAALVNADYNVIAQRQGTDYKAPKGVYLGVMPKDDYITHSCTVNLAGGTPVSSTTDCDDWVDSYTDAGVGDFDLNYTSIWREKPTCSCINSEINRGCAGRGGAATQATTTKAKFHYFITSTLAHEDSAGTIICRGRRVL